ncbi:putative methyltransferase-domain-containing protein [Lipomyces chichibuensis]|uniref:putative methyltransferase-domain-containing protein n=1 Tax=Lipomyces chichibuensis TaxID=1546026 RepID=UPI0033434536
MNRSQDLVASVRLYSRVLNRTLSEGGRWLIVARALCAWQTRDWELADYHPLAIKNLQVSASRSQKVEYELALLLDYQAHAHDKSIETHFLLFLAHFLRAQCLFERDKPVMARRDLTAALRCVSCWSGTSYQLPRSAFRFTVSSDIDVSALQLAILSNLRPLVLASLLSDAEVEIEVVSNSLHAFIKLVDRSVAALDSNGTGVVFYPKSLNIAMDAAAVVGNTSGGMIFRLIPREPFPRRELQSNGSTLTVHLGIVNEMNLYPREAIPAEMRIAVAADVIGNEHVNILCASGSPDVSEMYYPGLDFHGFYGSGKGAVTFRVASSSDEEFYILLYPIGCSELKIIPLVLGPFLVSHSRSDIDEDYPLSTLRPLYIDSSERIYVKESTSDLPGKVWDSALFLCDAIFDHLSNHREKTLSILDLSSGNGAVGLYLYRKVWKCLADEVEDLKLALTDVEEAIPLIKENATNCFPDTYHEIVVDTLYWGEEKKLDYSPFDIVIACDLIYDDEYFDVLLVTLERLCIPKKTIIFLGYKPRGLSSEEKSELWKRLAAIFQMKELEIQERIISGVSDIWNKSVGVEIWKLWR